MELSTDIVFEAINNELSINPSDYNQGAFIISLSSNGKLPFRLHEIIEEYNIAHYHYRVKDGSKIENYSYLIVDGICKQIIDRTVDIVINIDNIKKYNQQPTLSFESRVVEIIEDTFEILFESYFEKKLESNRDYN